MFHRRPSALASHIAALEGRLSALENELERIGRRGSRSAAGGISAAGDQIGEAIAPILSEIVDRFRSGRRFAGHEAARFGNEAVKIGGRMGNDALHRVTAEVEHRPLVTLGVALGVGILIGIAGRRH